MSEISRIKASGWREEREAGEEDSERAGMAENKTADSRQRVDAMSR